jgi:hypothetical protein
VLQKDYNLSKISKHIDSWQCGFISRFVNLTVNVKVKEEECKNQNYLHFGLFRNCFVSKVEAQNNVEAKSFFIGLYVMAEGCTILLAISMFSFPPSFVNNL